MQKCANLVDLERCCKMNNLVAEVGFYTAENGPSSLAKNCAPSLTSGKVKLHCTLVNTKYRGGGGGARESFDASALLEEWGASRLLYLGYK